MESPITTGRAYALPSFWLMKASGSPMRPVATTASPWREIHAVQELGGPAPEFHGGSHRAERIVRIAAVLLTDSRAVLIHGGAQVRRARGTVRVGFRRPVIGVRGEETANHLH